MFIPDTSFFHLLFKEQLIDVFKSVGQVVGFRCIRPLPLFLLVLPTPF
jgi:hypothetical protein